MALSESLFVRSADSQVSHAMAGRFIMKRTYHNASKTPEYKIWQGIRKRCYNPKSSSFEYYGGRGIKMSDSWVESFPNFLRDMGPRPTPGHTIDRKDNDGNYEPANCRWATRLEQANNSRQCREISYKGKLYNMRQLCELTNLKYDALRRRLKLGWSVDEAVELPCGQKTNKLAPSQAAEIKRLYATGEYSQLQLGGMFGCSSSNIYFITNGKTWAQVGASSTS